MNWHLAALKEPVVRARSFLDWDYATNEEDDEDYDPSCDNNVRCRQ